LLSGQTQAVPGVAGVGVDSLFDERGSQGDFFPAGIVEAGVCPGWIIAGVEAPGTVEVDRTSDGAGLALVVVWPSILVSSETAPAQRMAKQQKISHVRILAAAYRMLAMRPSSVDASHVLEKGLI
jgi:hypothetical protein